MAREIERKFLIVGDAWRASWQAAGAKSLEIRQYYLDMRDDFSVRVRVIDGNAAVLTIKIGAGLSRGEFEYTIPLPDVVELEAGRIGLPIEKRRHHIPHHGRLIELDVFAGALVPLVLAEIELETEEDALVLPPFFGREVTGDPAYSNARLALSGVPKDFGPVEAPDMPLLLGPS